MQAAENDEVLQCLVDLCSESPKFIRPQFDAVIEFCLKVCLLSCVHVRMCLCGCGGGRGVGSVL